MSKKEKISAVEKLARIKLGCLRIVFFFLILAIILFIIVCISISK